MKMRNYILIMAAMLVAMAACTKSQTVDFGTDRRTIQVGANGGVEKVQISSDDAWVATVGMQEDGTPNPWITVSPANGRGSVTCDIKIDSALTVQPRSAVVTIQNVATNSLQRIAINQDGYTYKLEVDNKNVEVKKYAEFGKRYFDVVVKTNFDFEVKIPQSAQHWVEQEPASKLSSAYQLDLNRGVRPREVKVRFNWKINNSAEIRLADIEFKPKKSIDIAHSDILSIAQEAAEPIIPDTRAGDSLALLNISNTMQCWNSYDTSVSMDSWSGITLWEERMAGCKPEWVGRVKRMEIFLCNAYEGLPY